MSYLHQEPLTYLNIKLTDDGRRLLSLGQLNFSKAVLSDREIKYDFDTTSSYNISCLDRVIGPKDSSPTLPLSNFDGTAPIPFNSIASARQITSASTSNFGFYTGSSYNWALDPSKMLGKAIIRYSADTPNGDKTIQMTGGTYFPKGGELMFVPWKPIQNSGNTSVSDTLVGSGTPLVCLWYRVLSANTATTVVTLDRNLPNFGATVATSQLATNAYFYPFSGIDSYYGSATTVMCQVWNMNIVRTSSVMGTDGTMSGYTTYGSINYNGSKQYFGFSSETREFGIVHYSNRYSGNTYAEQLIEGTVRMDIPHVMWHNSTANAGQSMTWGLTLYDAAGPTTYDSAAGTSYRPLRDGTSTSDMIVGRVYHKLKMMIITDPELLTALSYKSNRNFTLPQLSLSTSFSPKYPLSTSDATGILETGYTYYVTYLVDSVYPYSTTNTGLTYGHITPLNCAYISQIDGVNDNNGNPQFLRASFASNGFPFLRSGTGMETYSGTGWNANSVQLMVNKVNKTLYPNMQIDNLPSDSWKLISASPGGNGIYSGGSTTSIDAPSLLTYNYIISQEDYNSGTTFALSGRYSGFTEGTSNWLSGMTFGDESFFFGNVTADIMATTFKTVLTVLVPNTSFNSSNNPSFNANINLDTYITEIGVLDSNNVLVGVGKFTYPIPKNTSRFLAFQLEIDF